MKALTLILGRDFLIHDFKWCSNVSSKYISKSYENICDINIIGGSPGELSEELVM